MPSSPPPAAGGDRTGATTVAFETVTGSHELIIQGYSNSKGVLGVGRYVYSRTFTVGGISWHLEYFPDGECEEFAGNIAVALRVDPYVKGEVRARCVFSVLDAAGEPVPLYTVTSPMRTFSRTSQFVGSDLIRAEALESSPYLRDDSFRIRCDVTVLKEVHIGAPPPPSGSDHHRSPSDGGGATTTTIATEAVTGSHLLVVEGYSHHKGVTGVGKCLYSGTFTIGGHNWCVTYYPDGFNEDSQDYIAFFLQHVDPDNGDAKARCKLSLLDQDGGPSLQYTLPSEPRTFSKRLWGSPEFIRRTELEQSPYLKDDGFRIRCDVTVFKDAMRATTTVELPALPPSDLHRHLGDLLSGQVGWDFMFDVADETFKVHRNVLAARSPVFMAALFGPMKETGDRVRIYDVEPGVFKAFLHFIYTDLLPEVDEGEKVAMAQHLLVAADRYRMERLKMICEHILCIHVDTSTAATTLALAEQHGCCRLKEACLKFIASPSNLKVVMASDGFEHLMISCPSLLKELAANIAA
ncbi:hypothetical protein ACP70R_007694 [Stipagrostis hirtigluma subsp. patula]